LIAGHKGKHAKSALRLSDDLINKLENEDFYEEKGEDWKLAAAGYITPGE
jgi:hypothetical protein